MVIVKQYPISCILNVAQLHKMLGSRNVSNAHLLAQTNIFTKSSQERIMDKKHCEFSPAC